LRDVRVRQAIACTINRRLTNVVPSPSGSYTFLETAELKQD
jgi:ABC-type transport system substrate-binding protein